MEQKKQPQKEQNEVKISKKSLYIALAVVGTIILGIGGYFLLGNKNQAQTEVTHTPADSLAIKKDTINKPEEESEYYYGKYVVIANKVPLPDGKFLSFGDEVFVDHEKTEYPDWVIYLNNPLEAPSTKNFPISLKGGVLLDYHRFEEFKKYFSLPPYSTLPLGAKKILFDEHGKYSEGRTYNITQNADRAKSTIALGDFDNDGIKDVAAILDDNEYQESRLIIIGTNKATKNTYIAFAENYDDKLKIRSFSKGASIYMNSSDFVKAPSDGIIISSEDSTLAVIYDQNSQKFKTYEQVPYYEGDYDDYMIEN